MKTDKRFFRSLWKTSFYKTAYNGQATAIEWLFANEWYRIAVDARRADA